MTEQTGRHHENDEQSAVQDPAENYEVQVDVNETADSNDEDVDEALKRETDDGKGGAVVPKADFESFASDDVETTDSDEGDKEN